jgi:hypothetical protein
MRRHHHAKEGSNGAVLVSADGDFASNGSSRKLHAPNDARTRAAPSVASARSNGSGSCRTCWSRLCEAPHTGVGQRASDVGKTRGVGGCNRVLERWASHIGSKHCFHAKQRLRALSRVLYTTVWSAPYGGVATCSGVGTTCDARGRRRIHRTMRLVRVEQAILWPKQLLRALSHVLHTTVGSSSYRGVVTCFPRRKDLRRSGARSCSSNDALGTRGAGAARGEAALRSAAVDAAYDCGEHVIRRSGGVLPASDMRATLGGGSPASSDAPRTGRSKRCSGRSGGSGVAMRGAHDHVETRQTWSGGPLPVSERRATLEALVRTPR